jgi:hypothetical protein
LCLTQWYFCIFFSCSNFCLGAPWSSALAALSACATVPRPSACLVCLDKQANRHKKITASGNRKYFSCSLKLVANFVYEYSSLTGVDSYLHIQKATKTYSNNLIDCLIQVQEVSICPRLIHCPTDYWQTAQECTPVNTYIFALVVGKVSILPRVSVQKAYPKMCQGPPPREMGCARAISPDVLVLSDTTLQLRPQ